VTFFRPLLSAFRCAAAIVVLALAGCLDAPEPKLRIGTFQRPGFEPLFLARSLGYIDERRVQLVEFPSAAEMLLAYRNRAIDAATITTDDALRLAAEGQSPRLILLMNRSNGADAVLAKPPIGDVASLKGRKVAVESNALGGYLLARALSSAGLKLADVEMISSRVDRADRDLAAGTVESVVSYEPYRSRVMRRGVVPIFDSSKIPGEIADVLVVPAATAEEPPAALREVVAGWFRALDHLAVQRQDAIARMAPRSGLNAEQLGKALELIEFADLSENHRQLGQPTSPLAGKLRHMMVFMAGADLLPHEIDSGLLRTDRLLPPMPR